MRLILSILVLASALAAGGGAWGDSDRQMFLLPLLSLAGAAEGSAQFGSGDSPPADGAEIFAALKCGICHKPDKNAVAISLAETVRTFSDKARLVKFFKGEMKPLIESEKWGMMRGRLHKIKALPDEDKEALADYILSFK